MIGKPPLGRRLVTTDLPLVAIIFFALAPYGWMILTSLTPDDRLAAIGVALAPADWVVAN